MPGDPFRIPENEADALAEQERLRELVSADGPLPEHLDRIAGVDVAYAVDESCVGGAVSVLDAANLEEVASATVRRPVSFPYIPGLLAFRELPALLEALDRLEPAGFPPDVLVCDGYGLAHPRRFGLACHLGVITGLPTFGVAKTAFIGTYDADELGAARGSTVDLVDGGEVVGRVLRTQAGVKPVFVSVGHRIGLDEAVDLTLRLTPRYRLPETTRRADRLSRIALGLRSEHGPPARVI